MTDHDGVTPDQETGEEQESGRGRWLPILVFAIAAIGFLAYLLIGSVEARIWRFGRLYFEDRDVREVWSYFGGHLPQLPGQPVITALYWIALAVMVLGTVAGLWLFLGTEDEEPSAVPHGHDASPSTSHD